jgi:predicted deacylase
LNKKEIRLYLKELNDQLKKKKIKGEICIVGGAAMCLAFNAREATKDIYNCA